MTVCLHPGPAAKNFAEGLHFSAIIDNLYKVSLYFGPTCSSSRYSGNHFLLHRSAQWILSKNCMMLVYLKGGLMC